MWSSGRRPCGSIDAGHQRRARFLKHISDAFEERQVALIAPWGDDAAEGSRRIEGRRTSSGDARGPVEAREGLGRQSTVGLTVDAAMYPSLKTLEHDLGAVYEPDPRFPLDGSGGAWCFPDGSKLHLRAGRLSFACSGCGCGGALRRRGRRLSRRVREFGHRGNRPGADSRAPLRGVRRRGQAGAGCRARTAR